MKAYKRNRFYKNKFLLSIYDQEDQIIAVLDNVREFSSMFQIPLNSAYVIARRFQKGEQKNFYYQGKRLQLYFTELEREDMISLVGIN